MPLYYVAGTVIVLHIVHYSKPCNVCILTPDSCRRQSVRWLPMIPASWCACSYVISCFNVHCTYWLTSKAWIEHSRSDEMSTRDQTEKDNGFYCGCSLSPYTPPYTPPHIPLYSEERQLLCFKLSCKSSPCLWPTVCKDLRPVNSHRNEFESRSLPGEPLDDCHLDAALWGTLSQRHPAVHLDSWPMEAVK